MILELLACPVRKIVPPKFCALINETVVVPLAPGGTEIEVGLTVRTKLPVVLCASVIGSARIAPLTLIEPSEKISNNSEALREALPFDRVVAHSSVLSPCKTLSRLEGLRVL